MSLGFKNLEVYYVHYVKRQPRQPIKEKCHQWKLDADGRVK